MKQIYFTEFNLDEFRGIIIDCLKHVLPSLITPVTSSEPINSKQAAALLNIRVSTLYGLIRKKQIPHYKKSKGLYFFEEELLNWIKNDKSCCDNDVINAGEIAFLNANKNRKHK